MNRIERQIFEWPFRSAKAIVSGLVTVMAVAFVVAISIAFNSTMIIYPSMIVAGLTLIATSYAVKPSPRQHLVEDEHNPDMAIDRRRQTCAHEADEVEVYDDWREPTKPQIVARICKLCLADMPLEPTAAEQRRELNRLAAEYYGQVEPNRAVHPQSQPGPTPDDESEE